MDRAQYRRSEWQIPGKWDADETVELNPIRKDERKKKVVQIQRNTILTLINAR
jgi:hypothetical protein